MFSPIEVKPGTTLQLQVHTTDHEPPIQVSQAVVRWCRSGSFGCEFVSHGPDEWARLRQVVKDLEMQPYEKAQQETDAA